MPQEITGEFCRGCYLTQRAWVKRTGFFFALLPLAVQLAPHFPDTKRSTWLSAAESWPGLGKKMGCSWSRSDERGSGSYTFLSVPFTAIPSAPQAVISSVNETSLMLEWTPPRDTGGREDLVYNIICKSCGSGRGACTRCGDNVQFAPRQLGLTEPRIYISDLLAHTQYTFEIQAVNGVTDQSPFSPQFASVNITTNQAGKMWTRVPQPTSPGRGGGGQRSPGREVLVG